MSDEPRGGIGLNLAWGLAATAAAILVGLALVGAGLFLHEQLRQAGAVSAVAGLLPPRTGRLPPAAGLLGLVGPWLLAGVLVGGRVPWPAAVRAGAVPVGLFPGFALLSDPSAPGLENAIGLGLMSAAAGLTAVGLCIVRRRWRC